MSWELLLCAGNCCYALGTAAMRWDCRYALGIAAMWYELGGMSWVVLSSGWYDYLLGGMIIFWVV